MGLIKDQSCFYSYSLAAAIAHKVDSDRSERANFPIVFKYFVIERLPILTDFLFSWFYLKLHHFEHPFCFVHLRSGRSGLKLLFNHKVNYLSHYGLAYDFFFVTADLTC